nr:hypothetical protein [Tanacetum cinerariifolium]
MRNFMQNLHDGPPGEDKEHEATTDTELPSIKDIQPLPVQEPPQNSDIRQLIREEDCVEVPKEQKQSMEDTMLELVKICQEKEFLYIHDDASQLSLETESDEVTESNAENLLPIPSEYENNDDLDSSNNESLPDEDVPAEKFKIYSNPLFDEDEISSDKLDPHYFNVEYDFVESLLNRDTFIDFSSKIDFSGELAHIKLEIPKPNFDFEEEFRLIDNLLYDNSFPQPPEELNTEIADTIIESIPSLPIPLWDGDSQREEIDIVTKTDDVLPLSVENDDDLRRYSFLEELLIDDSILSHESSDSNFKDKPSIPQPPPEPPDAETDAGEETLVVMNDKDKFDEDFHYFIFDKVFSLLSAESEDTIFDPGISD